MPTVSSVLALPASPPARWRIQSRARGEKPRWNRSMLAGVIPRSWRYSWPARPRAIPTGIGGTLARPRRPPCRASACRRRRRAGARGRRRRRAGPSQRNARPLRQHRKRFAELDPFHLHDEAEDVPADVADPALPRLPLRVDLETGARVVVPGAEGRVAAALAAELHVAAHQVDNVDRSPDLFLDVRGRSKRHRQHLRGVRGEIHFAFAGGAFPSPMREIDKSFCRAVV